jgi:hypothetical protein
MVSKKTSGKCLLFLAKNACKASLVAAFWTFAFGFFAEVKKAPLREGAMCLLVVRRLLL